MLSPNNSAIDTAILAERINAELAALRTARDSAARDAMTFPATQLPRPAAQPAIGEPQRLARGLSNRIKQIPFVGDCAAWFVWIFRVRRIARAAFDAEAHIAELRARLDEQTGRFESHFGEFGNIRSDLTAVRAELASVCNELAAVHEQLAGVRDQFHHGLSERFADVSKQLAAVRHEVMFQQRRLSALAHSMIENVDPSKPGAELIYDQRLDSFYDAFEDVYRGSRADIKQRLTVYLDRIKLAGAGQPETPIIDIGCGRGEWLELLKENNLAAYGVDSNSMMVERCISFGLDARNANGLTHLRSLMDGSRSAITAFHVIEHLPFTIVVDLLDEALRVLKSGGMLILETPNPENMRVGATTFYLDPTHRNPIAPDPLRFLVEHRGFSEVEVARLHPVPKDERLTGDGHDIDLLNAIIFGPRDYAIVARRV